MNNALEIKNNQMSVQAVKQQFDLVQDLYKSIMKKDEHFGKIPGTKKDTLLKSGAEKLCLLFKLVPKIEMENKNDLGNGHREIEMTIGLYSKDDSSFWGQGTGSCSTMESKFRYRWKNGKRTDNPDIADIYNTVRKMCYKRALVSATITATGVSDIFTQDVEEMNPADLNNKFKINDNQDDLNTFQENYDKLSDAIKEGIKILGSVFVRVILGL